MNKTDRGKVRKTIKRYADLLSAFIRQLDRKLYALTAFDIRLYLSMYKEQRKVSNRILDNIRKVLPSFFGWMHMQHDRIKKNIFGTCQRRVFL